MKLQSHTGRGLLTVAAMLVMQVSFTAEHPITGRQTSPEENYTAKQMVYTGMLAIGSIFRNMVVKIYQFVFVLLTKTAIGFYLGLKTFTFMSFEG